MCSHLFDRSIEISFYLYWRTLHTTIRPLSSIQAPPTFIIPSPWKAPSPFNLNPLSIKWVIDIGASINQAISRRANAHPGVHLGGYKWRYFRPILCQLANKSQSGAIMFRSSSIYNRNAFPKPSTGEMSKAPHKFSSILPQMNKSPIFFTPTPQLQQN